MTPGRKLLARTNSIATRQRVYRVPDGLEVDWMDTFEVRRRRVLFDEVLLITYHRRYGKVLLTVSSLFVILAAATAFLSAQGAQDATVGWILFAIIGGPFFIVLLVHLIMKWDEINVYGRRSRATLRFGLRKSFARKLFEELVADARAAQSRSARIAEPVAPPELPVI
jgi:hypothetical protein